MFEKCSFILQEAKCRYDYSRVQNKSVRPLHSKKVIYGNQFIVVWHVGDLKLYHMRTGEVIKMLIWL